MASGGVVTTIEIEIESITKWIVLETDISHTTIAVSGI